MRRGLVALAVALTLTGCATGAAEPEPAPALEQVKPASTPDNNLLMCQGKPIPAPGTPEVPESVQDVAMYFHVYYSTYYATYCAKLGRVEA